MPSFPQDFCLVTVCAACGCLLWRQQSVLARQDQSARPRALQLQFTPHCLVAAFQEGFRFRQGCDSASMMQPTAACLSEKLLAWWICPAPTAQRSSKSRTFCQVPSEFDHLRSLLEPQRPRPWPEALRRRSPEPGPDHERRRHLRAGRSLPEALAAARLPRRCSAPPTGAA